MLCDVERFAHLKPSTLGGEVIPSLIMNFELVDKWLSYLTALHRSHGGSTAIRTLKPSWEFLGDSSADLISKLQGIPEWVKDKRPQYYTTLNPVKDAEGKVRWTPDQPKELKGRMTDEDDITAYLWLPLDFDPIRYELNKFGERQLLSLKDLSSTEEELRNAQQAVGFVSTTISKICGVSPTVLASSGNGYHSLYRVDDGGDLKGTKELVHQILIVLSAIYKETPLKECWVSVDTSVANYARIWKLYGSVATKGMNLPDRPWREASLVTLDETQRALGKDDLVKILRKLEVYLSMNRIKQLIGGGNEQPCGGFNTPARTTSTLTGTLNNKEWIKAFKGYDLKNLDVIRAMTYSGWINGEQTEIEKNGRVAVICPNSGEHSSDTGSTQTVIQPKGDDGGYPAFFCHHSHCQHLNGAEFLFTKMLTEEQVKANTPKFPTVELPAEVDPLQVEKRDAHVPVDFCLPDFTFNKTNSTRGKEFYEEKAREKREVLIEGFLSRGEVGSLQSSTKIGKTWMLMHAAILWSNGLPYLGLTPTKKLKIAIVDPELFADTAFERLRFIENITKLALDMRLTLDNVVHYSLRGHPLLYSEDPFRWLVESVKSNQREEAFDTWMVDSIYKFEGDRDSNSRGVVTRMMALLQSATGVDSSIVYTHHYAKGNASEKGALDRAGGSMAYNSNNDSIMTVTPLKDQNCYVAEFNLRAYPGRAQIGLRKLPDCPLLEVADDVDVNRVDTTLARKWSVAENVMCIIRDISIEKKKNLMDEVVNRDELFRDCRRKLEIDDRWIKDGLNLLREEEYIVQHGGSNTTARSYWTITPSGDNYVRALRVLTVDGGVMTPGECRKHDAEFKGEETKHEEKKSPWEV